MTQFVSIGFALLVLSCGAYSENGEQSGNASTSGASIQVDMHPRLAVGVESGDPNQEFDQVTTPFLLANGSLVIPSAGHSEIRVFDQTGQFIRAYGRSGRGPGEFVRLAGAWSRGDTIEALDLALRRITRIMPSGETEVIPLNGPYVLWDVGPVSDGWVLVNIVAPGLQGASPRDQLAAYWFNGRGEHVADLATAEGMERTNLPGRVAASLFSPTTRFDVRNDEVYIGETVRSAINVVDLTGRPIRTIRWEPQAVTAPEDALDRVQAALRDHSPPDVQELLEAPLPDTIPVFTDFLIDEEGLVWIRPYLPERDPTVLGGTVALHRTNRGGEWLVLDQTGATIGSVALPADLEPTQITRDAVVGIARDTLGVEMVRVHTVIRR